MVKTLVIGLVEGHGVCAQPLGALGQGPGVRWRAHCTGRAAPRPDHPMNPEPASAPGGTAAKRRRAPVRTPAPAVGFVSLGCPKALVDSERIITELKLRGYGIAPQYRDADLVVVNTCGFIEAAIDESLSAIGEALNQNGRVVVTGCLGMHPDRIRARHPKVLAIPAPHPTPALPPPLNEHLPQPHNPHLYLLPPQGIRLTPPHYAYLKISPGCNNKS